MSSGSGLPRRRTPLRSADPRATRQADILLRLHTGEAATATSLADDVKVALRTVYRDLADLQAAGFPLSTGKGPGGGVELADGWVERLHEMTRDEVMALLLQVTPNTAGHLGLSAVATARKRAEASPDSEHRAAVLAERCLLDFSGWFTRAEEAPALPVLSCAVWDGRRVALDDGRGELEIVDPLGLVIRTGHWYAVAAVDGALRSYRVRRITAAELCEEPARRPDGFVLADWWTDSAAQMDGVPAAL